MNYRISIAKADARFEAEGDKKFVLQMLAQYGGLGEDSPVVPLKGEKAGQITSRAAGLSVALTVKKASVGEFIRQLGVKKHMDFVVAFGYYLEKVAGLTSFTVADINNCYYEAKLENSNTSQMIIQNIKNGRIMQGKGKSGKGRQAFVLTNSGEQYVSNFVEKHQNAKT